VLRFRRLSAYQMEKSLKVCIFLSSCLSVWYVCMYVCLQCLVAWHGMAWRGVAWTCTYCIVSSSLSCLITLLSSLSIYHTHSHSLTDMEVLGDLGAGRLLCGQRGRGSCRSGWVQWVGLSEG
jgi:hypothetical protein